MQTQNPASRRRFAVLALPLLLVAACATPDDWVKPGVDAATTARDYDNCESLAMRADMRAAVGPMDEDLGTSVDSLPAVSERGEYLGDTDLSEGQLRAILGRCMQSRGYARAPG
jgi:hypothetical protein